MLSSLDVTMFSGGVMDVTSFSRCVLIFKRNFGMLQTAADVVAMRCSNVGVEGFMMSSTTKKCGYEMSTCGRKV